MKIAVVVPGFWYKNNPSKSSIDFDLYLQAIAALGHEPLLVCYEGSEFDAEDPVLAVGPAKFEEPAFWRGLHLDIALVFTWLRHARLVQTLQATGIYVISRADTDGMVSVRVYPRYHWQVMVDDRHTPEERARAMLHWGRRYFTLYKRADQEVLDSVTSAAVTIVETHFAEARLGKMFAYYGREELQAKIMVLPHLVSKDILTAPLSIPKTAKIVAVGRWDALQKDAPLLNKVVTGYLQNHPEAEAVLIGKGGERVFADLTARCKQARYIGAIPHGQIREHFASAQVCLVTSRWESFHIAAHEALCMGCTVVGPPVIPLYDVCAAGAFGTMAASRDGEQVLNALEKDMTAWQEGCYRPEQLAAFWRARLSGVTVVQQLLDKFAQPSLSE